MSRKKQLLDRITLDSNLQTIINDFCNKKGRLRNILENDHKIVANYEDKYIIKLAISDEIDNDEIINEGIIGIICMNNHQGFSQILGVGRHRCPTIFNNQEFSFLVSEYIDGLTFYDFVLKKHQIENFSKITINILKKIFNNLYAAYKDCDFTHYDFHHKNIMVDFNNEPYIIDYGYSHAKFQGLAYGIKSASELHLNQDEASQTIETQSNWLADV